MSCMADGKVREQLQPPETILSLPIPMDQAIAKIDDGRNNIKSVVDISGSSNNNENKRAHYACTVQ